MSPVTPFAKQLCPEFVLQDQDLPISYQDLDENGIFVQETEYMVSPIIKRRM